VQSKVRGSGSTLSKTQSTLVRASFGPDLPPILDLNKAQPDELRSHPLVGKALSKKLLRLRKQRPIVTPGDVFHAGLISRDELRSFQHYSHGSSIIKPLLKTIEVKGGRLFVGESFSLEFSWVATATARPEILSLNVRFPSGRRSEIHLRLSRNNQESGLLSVPGFVSGESGEFYVLATLRDGAGGVSQQSAIFNVFTRNPVQMFVTPQYLTKSGSAGAPKYNFAEKRWYCNADIRWVNGENFRVNLGRRVDVHVTDAGIGTVADLTFNLTDDIVIPALSTIYGNWVTSHGSGPIFDEFSAKGDLTFQYRMNGSGFSPTRSLIWRTMRTIGYNCIRVGDFTGSEIAEYQKAGAVIASGILRSRDLTVHGTELYKLEGTPELDADKARWRFIDNDEEARTMWAKYSIPNWYLDVFMVEGLADGLGTSPVNGPGDKKGINSGIVIAKDGDTVNMGQTFAHESGHHLGLEHADENDGCADTDPASSTISDNFIFSASKKSSAVITGCQIDKMRQHPLVRSLTY
jgi:hypothetical protein